MIKKLLLTALILSTSCSLFAQKYITRTGRILFNATAAKSPEKIEAINNEVANVIDIKSGDIVFQVLIKSFKFERELMKEHFNENYLESDKYPKSDFKGSITNLSDINFSNEGTYSANVSGKLTIHGISQPTSVKGTIVVNQNSIKLNAKIVVKLKDYNISIPSLVADKISQEVTITLESDFSRK